MRFLFKCQNFFEAFRSNTSRAAKLLLPSLVGIAALWFVATASIHIFKYARLDARYPAKVFHWEIEKKGSSQFAITGHFIYEVKGKTYKNKATLKKPYHLNEISAQAYLDHLQLKMQEIVWVDSSSPGFSSFEKEFPLKKVVYAVIVLSVFIYMAALIYKNSIFDYLQSRSSKNRKKQV